MVNITQEFGKAVYVIKGYGPEGITINDQVYTQSLVVAPDHLDIGWGPTTCAGLSVEAMDAVMRLNPELVVLGTGSTLTFPGRDILLHMRQQGIGLEVMDTAAACRTYNILMSEGRNVAAALIRLG